MRLEIDKVAHYGISGMITLVLFTLTGSFIWTVIIAMLGTSAKECWDLLKKGSFSVGDIIANMAGVITALICLKVIILGR